MGELKTIMAPTVRYILDEDERRRAFEIWKESGGDGNYYLHVDKIVYEYGGSNPQEVEICEVDSTVSPVGKLMLDAFRRSYAHFEQRWDEEAADLRELKDLLEKRLLQEYLELDDEAVGQ